MSRTYRKKPVVIEAMQLTESNIFAVTEFIEGRKPDLRSAMAQDKWDDYVAGVKEHGLTIRTLEDGKDGRAKHVADIGDWIIKGVQGEFYPCKPDIFAATYEPAEGGAA